MSQKGHALSQSKGTIALVPLIIILLLIVAGVAYFIGSKGNIKNPFQKQPKPQLKTEYKNPFEKESSYVNPFDGYKNPFDVIGAEGHE